jgi:23S rRNA pseudouridine955/2504/2580 synthase
MKNIDFKDLIILENEDYIIINKPPYISSLDERTPDKAGISIIRMAKDYHTDAQLCHRLDKETSGALAIAKHAEAYRNLAMQFEDRIVDKTYHAVVNGIHEFNENAVRLPIKQLKNGTVIIDREEGKEAETLFKTLEVFKQNTLVGCKPITGRMHQIRVHLQCLKASIVGDLQYGGKDLFLSEIKRKFNLKQDTEEQPLIKRVALHASSLAFLGLDQVAIRATASYPKDITALLKQLRNFS